MWDDGWLNELYEKEAQRERKRESPEPTDPKEKEADQDERPPKRQRGESLSSQLPTTIPYVPAVWDGPTGDAEQAQDHAAAVIQPNSGVHSGEGTSSGTYLRLTPNDIQTHCPACLQRLLKTWIKLSLKHNSTNDSPKIRRKTKSFGSNIIN